VTTGFMVSDGGECEAGTSDVTDCVVVEVLSALELTFSSVSNLMPMLESIPTTKAPTGFEAGVVVVVGSESSQMTAC